MTHDNPHGGLTRADLATQLLDAVERHIGDPHSVAVAQVHATLAVADALTTIAITIAAARNSALDPDHDNAHSRRSGGDAR